MFLFSLIEIISSRYYILSLYRWYIHLPSVFAYYSFHLLRIQSFRKLALLLSTMCIRVNRLFISNANSGVSISFIPRKILSFLKASTDFLASLSCCLILLPRGRCTARGGRGKKTGTSSIKRAKGWFQE